MYFPDIATQLASATPQITAVIVWALPAVVILIGLALGGLGLAKFRRAVVGAVAKAIGAGRRRGGRRRR